MNRSVSKIRHIQKLNERFEKRFLNEDEGNADQEVNDLIGELRGMLTTLTDCKTMDKCYNQQAEITSQVSILIPKLQDFVDVITNPMGI